MQVTVNDIDTRYVLGVKVFTTPQMKPHSDKCAANVRQIGTASIVDETVRSLLTETYRKARPEVVKHVDEMLHVHRRKVSPAWLKRSTMSN